MSSEEEGILLTNMKKQIQMISAQLQRLKEEENTSSNKFSLREIFPSSYDNQKSNSCDLKSKISENTSQTPKKSEGIFENKPWEPKTKRDFTPLGKSYELTLEQLLEEKLIILHKVTLAGVYIMNNYCAYHRHNLHKTSHCKELKNKIQDLFDNGIIQKSKLSSTKYSTLKKDQHHETKSSNGLNVTLTSSNMHSASKVSKLSNIPPQNKAPHSFSVDHVYLQGLPLKKTQDNLDLVAKLSHTTQTKGPKPTYAATTPIMPTPTIPSLYVQEPTMQTPHSTLSLEVDPCQEDFRKDQDQDQEPSHLPQDLVPPCPMPCTSTKKDQDIPSTISKEIIKDQEKDTFPILPKIPFE